MIQTWLASQAGKFIAGLFIFTLAVSAFFYVKALRAERDAAKVVAVISKHAAEESARGLARVTRQRDEAAAIAAKRAGQAKANAAEIEALERRIIDAEHNELNDRLLSPVMRDAFGGLRGSAGSPPPGR